DVAGTTVAVANGSNGISFLDASSPASPRLIAAQSMQGNAWSVALSRGAMYVATEVGVTAVSNVGVPPMINESLITVTPAATSATVTGTPNAISGIRPITLVVRDTVTN